MMDNSPNQFILLSLGITNCFLIPYRKDFLLVDTSTGKYFKKFKLELVKRSIALSQIKYVFLTHHHTDHTGFLKELLEESRAILIVHKNALPFLKKGINNPEMIGNSCIVRLLTRLQDFFGLARINKEVNPDENAVIIDSDNNDILRNIGITAKIICLPGHTSDSISLIFDDGTAFIGDAAMNMFGFLNLRNRPLVAENSSMITESWNKIKQHGGKTLYVSHGKCIDINNLQFNVNF